MRISEWIVCGFFAYLVVLARLFPVSGRRRARVLLWQALGGGTLR